MMYNILDYGACTDGCSVCTESIQKAIDACNENGGGRVLVPAGKYVSGTFYLKDNVELHLEQGALIKASPDINDYNDEDAYPQNFGCLSENWLGKHLVIALECKNVAITGFGIIDGNGEHFIEDMRPDCYHGYYGWRKGLLKCRYPEVQRPGQLICFIESSEILVDGKLDIIFDERLIERGFGEYEGTKPDMELLKRHWDYKLNDSEKGVESHQDCIKRANDFLNYVKETCDGKKVLIVSHGCTIKAMHFICEGYDENTDFLSFFPHNSKVYSYKLD